MSKKDFFLVIIKLLGVYWTFTLLMIIPQTFGIISWDTSALVGILYIIPVILLFIALFVFMIFKADLVLKWLKLDKGFDDDRIELPVSMYQVICIGIILFGAKFLLDNLYPFFRQLYYLLNNLIAGTQDIMVNPLDKSQLVRNGIQILIGYVLITCYPAISRYILKIAQVPGKGVE